MKRLEALKMTIGKEEILTVVIVLICGIVYIVRESIIETIGMFILLAFVTGELFFKRGEKN